MVYTLYMKSERSAGQKAALIGLLFLGIVTLGLGFFKVRSQIVGPFEAQISRAQEGRLDQFFEQQQQQEDEDVEVQKKSDTDGDLLSDYDELTIHKTSPYVKDTDSDGYDDKTEIDNAHDPNCAAGKACVPSASTTAEGQTDAGVTGTSSTVSVLEQDLKKLESLTPAQVRELLQQKGFTDADLEGVDDESLMALYRESLQKALEFEKQKAASQSSAPQLGALPGGASAQKTQEQLQQELVNLTKPQIIQMLTDTGQLSQDQLVQLQQLDESQLKQLFYTALEQAQQNYDAKRQ